MLITGSPGRGPDLRERMAGHAAQALSVWPRLSSRAGRRALPGGPDDTRPGETEGGADNWHRGADQWLFVVAGTGEAVVNGQTVSLQAGTLLLISRGDTHEIRNTGEGPLRTLNVYVPPAYTEGGEELPRGKK